MAKLQGCRMAQKQNQTRMMSTTWSTCDVNARGEGASFSPVSALATSTSGGIAQSRAQSSAWHLGHGKDTHRSPLQSSPHRTCEATFNIKSKSTSTCLHFNVARAALRLLSGHSWVTMLVASQLSRADVANVKEVAVASGFHVFLSDLC